MIRIFELLRRLAPSEIPVLITGETGVGKEYAAHAVHAWSPRAGAPFVALNCAALQDTLVESELFGYQKGAFSGATAAKIGILEAGNGGTVFLDEIGELSPPAQAKLLRALDTKRITRLGEVKERPVDFRIVAATNRDLEDEVAAGRFRRDLFFRLSTAVVHVPPLRERRRELPIFARTFLRAACDRANRPPMSLAHNAVRAFASYDWPGNVRELKHVMEYAAAAAEGNVLDLPHLPDRLRSARVHGPPAGAPEPMRAAAADSALPPAAAAPPTPAEPVRFRPIGEEIEDLERQRIADALRAANGIQVRAAELIGMPRRTFDMKVRKYGIKASLAKS